MTQIPEALIHVGTGWHPLLMRLHEKLIELKPDYRVGQVKEKFGTLRVYLDDYSPYMETWVERAEKESATVCEDCGSPGSLRSDRYWVRTLCDGCHVPRETVDERT